MLLLNIILFKFASLFSLLGIFKSVTFSLEFTLSTSMSFRKLLLSSGELVPLA